MKKNQTVPVVSVVMSAYNEECFINKAIQSIVGQTFSKWELIIVDDGSNDDTANIVRVFAEEDSRIVLLENKSNMGLPASLNKGIAVARGEYIARADADDFNLPDRLEKQYEFMQANPEIDVLGTAAFLLDEAGKRVNTIYPPTTHEQLKRLGFLKTIFFHPSVMIRKRFFKRAGLYDVSYTRSQDKELWLRGLQIGCRYANLAEPLIEYRTDGYVRSWRSIKDKTMSSWRLVKQYNIKQGYLLTVVSFGLAMAVKFGLICPRSLRLPTDGRH